MGRRMYVALGVVAMTLSLTGVAGAAFEDWAIGAKAGSLGIGGELTTDLLPNVHLRGGVQGFGFDFQAEFSDIDYDVDVDLLNPMLAVDWYPFSGMFRVSAGVVFNNSDITLDAASSQPIEIGGSVYDPADLGSLRGSSDFDDVAPYVGIGFGNPLSSNGHWGFMTEAGVAFIGSPNVNLRATGPFANNPALLADLAEEEREIEDDLDAIRIYPVLSMALYYRF